MKKRDILTKGLGDYNSTWFKDYEGSGKIVLFPKTTKKVSQIMKYCNAHNLAVVPQGGNTGLVGGSVPIHDEVIVSMKKMNKILDFDEQSNIITTEAGVILQDLQEHIEKYNVESPFDLGAKGSC